MTFLLRPLLPQLTSNPKTHSRLPKFSTPLAGVTTPKSISNRPPLKASQTPFGGAGVENLTQSCPHAVVPSGATHVFIRRTRSKPCPRGRGGGEEGGDGGAGWARGSPHGPLSAARPMLCCLHSSRLPRPVMALQMATALQQHSEPSRQSTRRREINAISRVPAPSPSFSRPASGYK
jgi:hypothetical protein